MRIIPDTPADRQGRQVPVDMALDPYIDDVLANGFDAPVRSRATGRTLVQAVIDAGGVDPDSMGGGDLLAMDANLRPGLLRRGGLSVEAMGEALAEQDSGFSDMFTTKDEYGRPELNEFLGMLTDELGGGSAVRERTAAADGTFDANRAEVADAMRALELAGVDTAALSRPALRRRIEAELGADPGTLYQGALPNGAESTVEFANAEAQLQSRLAQWSASFVQDGGAGPRAVAARPDAIGPVARNDSGAAEQGDQSREAIREQSGRLIERARADGFFWEAGNPIFAALDGVPKLAGSEHQAFIVGEGGNRFVIRATANGYFGPRADISPAQYLARLDDYSRTFPNLQTRLIGVSESPDVEGNAIIWTVQPFVEGEKFKHQSQLVAAMEAHGWETVDGPHSYEFRHKETGAVIADAHTDNVFQDESGNLYPFDVVVEKLPSNTYFQTGSAFRSALVDAVTTAKGAPKKGDAALEGQPLFQSDDDVRGSIWFTLVETIIRLTGKANLSTVHHEFGHLFLNGLLDDAFLTGADPKLAQDLDAFLAWRGKTVRVADGPSAVREAIERADHEAFAGGYETYLFEGKAPSAQLADLFARFRSWMVAIYGALRAKKVPISDEMRGVYDRLLATDAEIAEAEGVSGLDGLPAGLSSLVSPERWKVYVDQLQAARDGARALLQAKVLQAHQREAEAWWQEERAKVEEEVRQDAYADRNQRALSLLARGVLPDGTKPAAAFAPLDAAALKDEFGERFVIDRLKDKRVYRNKDGIAPAMAAEMLGYRNAAALVEALANVVPLETWIQQETDARMRAKYTDPRTDGTLPQKALAAVHGNKRLDALDAELALVAEMAGQPAPPARVLGALARRMINDKPLRQVRPNDYLVAERAASRDAQRLLSLARPRLAEALMAKRRQVMNAHLYRAALEAKEVERKQTAYLRKFTKRGKRARLGKVGGDYLEQVDNLLGQISLTPASAPEIGRRAALLQFVRDAEARGQTITVPESLLRLAETTNVRDLSVDALRGVADTVRQIDHLAKTKESLLLGKERRDAAEVDEAMAGSVR